MRHQGHRDMHIRGEGMHPREGRDGMHHKEGMHPREGRDGMHHREGMHPREHHHGKMGAKTFRRGRAIAFLEVLNTKKATLQKQLTEPELQSINQVIAGELKAIEMVISEFVQVFELHESEIKQTEETSSEHSLSLASDASETEQEAQAPSAE